MSFKDKILNNQSPWGTPPGGGGPSGNGSGTRREPPSLDDIIKNFQKTINKFSGGKSGGSKPFVLGFIILVFKSFKSTDLKYSYDAMLIKN